MLRDVNLISAGGTTNLEILKATNRGGKLHGLIEIPAMISSDPQAKGIRRAIDFGFPEKHIYVATGRGQLLAEQLRSVFERYEFDRFHQLGWIPRTPAQVLAAHKGLNQHLGPGGRYMIGPARVWTHMRFNEIIGQKRPIPIFCQEVHERYDQGDVIHVEFYEGYVYQTVRDAAACMLPIEHEVQIDALEMLATNATNPRPVPSVYENEEERKLMDALRFLTTVIPEEDMLNHRFGKKDKTWMKLEKHNSPCGLSRKS